MLIPISTKDKENVSNYLIEMKLLHVSFVNVDNTRSQVVEENL